MNLLTLFLITLTVHVQAGPVCDSPKCPVVKTPEQFEDLFNIRNHVTNECPTISELVVSPPHPDDPCSFANINNVVKQMSSGGPVYYTTRIDGTYVPGGKCQGKVEGTLCYIKKNDIYAVSGSTKYLRNAEGDGIIADIRQDTSPCSSVEECAYPFEKKHIQVEIPWDNIYDAQDRLNTVIECEPRNCYAIRVGAQDFLTPGKTSLGGHIITVTRLSDKSLQTKLYVNTSHATVTTLSTFDGRVGDAGVGKAGVTAELINKKPDDFASCSVPYSERIATQK